MADNNSLVNWESFKHYDEKMDEKLDAHIDDDTIHLTAEKAIEAAATAISNPNLLINPDLSINQHGLSTYTSTTRSMVTTADCWLINTIADGDTVSYIADTKTLSFNGTGDGATIRQIIENPERLSRKVVTFAVELESFNCSEWSIHIWRRRQDSSTVDECGSVTSVTNKALCTTTIPEISLGDDLHVIIAIADGEISIKNTKFEIGAISTPFVAIEPSIELAKCQQYCLKCASGEQHRSLTVRENFVTCFIPTPQTMRVAPSIFSGSFELSTRGSTNVVATNVATSSLSANGFILTVYATGHGMSDPVVYFASDVIFDAGV